MFEQSTITNGPAGSRIWSTGAGLVGEALLVTLAAIAPMVLPQAAPKLPTLTHLVFPLPQPPLPPAAPSVQPRSQVAMNNRQVHGSTVFVPRAIPPVALTIIDDPADFAPSLGAHDGIPGGVPGGVPDGVLGSVLSSAHVPAPPAPAPVVHPPAAPVPAAAPPRVRVGGLVKPAVIVSRTEPVFPVMAQRMRISGVVELEGVIGTDGRIRELRVLSGHPLLVKAAVDAVRQWVYRPTTLNGDPVEVISPIIVTFRLN